jgi:FMN phosphatase YigB (HAD superfamily)
MVTAHYQSVVFVDLDRTVIESSFTFAVFQVACGEIASKSGLDIKKIRCLVKQENTERQKNPNVDVVLAMDWDDILQTIATRLGVILETNVLEFIRSHAGPPHSRLLDNADKVLQRLTSPHRAIVAATNGLSKYQLPVLDALQLTLLFDDILTPDSSNALKNDIDFYGQWPDTTKLQIIVGDDYEFDIQIPHRFGFKTIWKLNGKKSKTRRIEPFRRLLELDI